MRTCYSRPSTTRNWALLSSICAVLLLSSCSSYSGPSEYELKKQAEQRFVDLVKEQGGTAEQKYYDMYGRSGMAWEIGLNGAEISDELIELMADKGYVAKLDLSKSTITDAQLARLDELKVGRVVLDLNLSDTGITDAGLDSLKQFYCLQKLNLKGTSVTDEAVKRLKSRQASNKDVPAPFKKGPEVEM